MSEAEQILAFISEELAEAGEELTVDTSLFREQRLDSMNLTELMAFLEETFGIKVSAMDISFENFDTAALMAEFVKRKKGAE